jgi:hypothetical protein
MLYVILTWLKNLTAREYTIFAGIASVSIACFIVHIILGFLIMGAGLIITGATNFFRGNDRRY